MDWITWSLVSALLTAVRYLYIRRFCSTVPSDVLVLVTRAAGTVVFACTLGPRAVAAGFPTAGVFWPVTVLTVVLTAVATLLQVSVVKRYPLSGSVPYFSFVPLFMVPWTALLLHEVPGAAAFAGIAVSCAGLYLLNRGEGGRVILGGRNARFMLAGALLIGLTTTCDKIAISASSVAVYALVWTALSVFLNTAITLYRSRLRSGTAAAFRNGHAYVQAVFWAGAFFAQMAGIRSAADISSGVTYVKLLTMFHVLLGVGGGALLFGEKRPLRNLAAAGLMVGGAVLVVLGH